MRFLLSSVCFALLTSVALFGWTAPSQGHAAADISQNGNWAALNSGTASELRSVHFLNDTDGWAAGDNATLLRTTNGGTSWTAVPTGAQPATGFNTVRALDQTTVWAGGSSVLVRTTSGGLSWSVASLPATNLSSTNVKHNSFFPISATQIWTGGEGNSLSSGFPAGTEIRYELSTGNVLAISANAAFTLPGGATRIITDLHFVDQNLGWAVGNTGFIMKTDLNQPGVFTSQTVAIQQQFNAIFMLNATTGWIVGSGGVIYKTTNGTSWAPLTSGTTANLRGVMFIDANRGWAVGDGGVILTTGNGGTSWTPEQSNVTANLLGVYAVNSSIVYAVGANGTIIKRTAATVTTVSAASFSGAVLAVDSIVAGFGDSLATATQVASTVPLPTTLVGTTIKVRDSLNVERSAPLFFVSPNQANYQIPPGTAVGIATITATNSQGASASGTAQIAAVAPGLFTANSSGSGVAAAVALRIKADNTQVFEPIARFDSAQSRFVSVPIDLGPPSDQVFVLLYGTGIRNRSSLQAVTATIGGTPAEVQYAGQQPDFIGLDQVNIPLSRNLAGRGEVDVVLTADGRTANTVRINIGGTGTAPVIANLTLNNPTMNGTTATISGRFDFSDPDGDIAFNGALANSAKIRFTVQSGQNVCTLDLSGPFLNFNGQTVGTVNFNATYNFTTTTSQQVSVEVRLIDVAGNLGNTASASASQWFCGLGERESLSQPDWFAEPAWLGRLGTRSGRRERWT